MYFVELTSNAYWIFLTFNNYLKFKQIIMFILNILQILTVLCPMVLSCRRCTEMVSVRSHPWITYRNREREGGLISIFKFIYIHIWTNKFQHRKILVEINRIQIDSENPQIKRLVGLIIYWKFILIQVKQGKTFHRWANSWLN